MKTFQIHEVFKKFSFTWKNKQTNKNSGKEESYSEDSLNISVWFHSASKEYETNLIKSKGTC